MDKDNLRSELYEKGIFNSNILDNSVLSDKAFVTKFLKRDKKESSKEIEEDEMIFFVYNPTWLEDKEFLYTVIDYSPKIVDLLRDEISEEDKKYAIDKAISTGTYVESLKEYLLDNKEFYYNFMQRDSKVREKEIKTRKVEEKILGNPDWLMDDEFAIVFMDYSPEKINYIRNINTSEKVRLKIKQIEDSYLDNGLYDETITPKEVFEDIKFCSKYVNNNDINTLLSKPINVTNAYIDSLIRKIQMDNIEISDAQIIDEDLIENKMFSTFILERNPILIEKYQGRSLIPYEGLIKVLSKKYEDKKLLNELDNYNLNIDIYSSDKLVDLLLDYSKEVIKRYTGYDERILSKFLEVYGYDKKTFDNYLYPPKDYYLENRQYRDICFDYHKDALKYYEGTEDKVFSDYIEKCANTKETFDLYLSEEEIKNHPMWLRSKSLHQTCFDYHPEYIKYYNGYMAPLDYIIDKIEKNDLEFYDAFQEDNMRIQWLNNNRFLKLAIKEGIIDEKVIKDSEVTSSIDSVINDKAYDYSFIYKLLKPGVYNKIFNNKNKFPFDFSMIARYTFKNSNIGDFLEIVIDDKLDKILEYYEYLKDLYPHEGTDSFGLTLLMDIASKEKDESFTKILDNLISSRKRLTEEEKELLLFTFKNNDIDDNKITNLEDVKPLLLDKLKKDFYEVEKSDVDNRVDLYKDFLCKSLTGKNYDDFIDMLEHIGDFVTLTRLYETSKTEENDMEIVTGLITLHFLYNTFMATSDEDDLNMLCKKLIGEDKHSLDIEKIIEIKNYMENYEKHMRLILEREANEKLTSYEDIINLKVPGSILKEEVDGIKVIDMTKCEYTLYAHALRTDNDELFNVKIGRNYNSQICLSPISDLGKKIYTEDFSPASITVVYTELPEGTYIGSSNRNMNSNKKIDFGSMSDEKLRKLYYQLGIRDTTNSLLTRHPETVVRRDNLLPKGIIHRDEIDINLEIKYARYLESLYNKGIKNEKDKIKIPVLITQKEGTKSVVPEENRYYKTSRKIDIPYDVPCQLKVDDVYAIVPRDKDSLGTEHDYYYGYVKGKEDAYFIKPIITIQDRENSYVSCVASLLQKQINPSYALDTLITTINTRKEGKLDCKAVKNIEITDNYLSYQEDKDRTLTKEEINSFMHEFIIDHLLYNYNTSGDNFAKSNDSVYGINKEDSLKYIIKDDECKELSPSFSLDNLKRKKNSKESIYTRIFNDYKEGKQEIPDEVFKDCMEKCTKIENMKDDEYLKMFEGYLNNSVTVKSKEKKKIVRNALLLRKNNLIKEYDMFISRLKEEVKHSEK